MEAFCARMSVQGMSIETAVAANAVLIVMVIWILLWPVKKCTQERRRNEVSRGSFITFSCNRCANRPGYTSALVSGKILSERRSGIVARLGTPVRPHSKSTICT